MQAIYIDDLVHILTTLLEKGDIDPPNTMWHILYNYVNHLEPGVPISDELYADLLEPIDSELIARELKELAE